MSCSNCYNGCAETTSDQCVKYTGVDVSVLGIKNGDSLSYVEQSLIEFLTSTLDGTGIKLNIPSDIICDIVKNNIPTCEDLTLVNIINALIKATCAIEERIKDVEDDITALEGSYTIGCLTGVTSTSGTHAVLQAVITKLCSVETSVTALSTNVSTNYVKLADLNTLIASYLSSTTATTKYYSRMVPNTVVEYYGSISGKFDASGAGLGDWEKIYLCNGNNGTPDKRGRVGVGVTSGMGGGALSSVVDPAVAGNPSYTLLGTQGSNNVTLTVNQIPSHNHTATVTDPGHNHSFEGVVVPGGSGTGERKSAASTLNTSSATTGITVSVGNTGGGLPHANFQPGLGCYYIMYIP